MHLSLQFFNKETDNERLPKHSQEKKHKRKYTSQYTEIEVDGMVYPVYLYQPTKDTADPNEIIKNLINRTTISCQTLAKEIDWSYNEDSLNRFESARKGDL